MEYLAVIFPIISLFVYAALLSIECGASIFVADPKLLGDSQGESGEKGAARPLVHSLVNPLWEVTNVFLVFAFISMLAFFPGAIPFWGTALATPFFFVLAVMGMRIMGMLAVFYGYDENGKDEGESRADGGRTRAATLFLLIASLLTPMVLVGALVPFFFTGTLPFDFYGWLFAAALGVFALATTIFLSSLFFAAVAARKGRAVRGEAETLSRFSFIFFLLAAAEAEVALSWVAPYVFDRNIVYYPLFGGAVLLHLLLTFRSRSAARTSARGAVLRFWSGLLMFAVVFFGTAFSALPYLVYPSATIFNSFTGAAAAGIMFAALGVGALIVIPALVLLYYLFI